MFKSFQRWSFSQLDAYRSCPYKARLMYIERSPQPPPAADSPPERGKRVHKAMEDFLLGSGELSEDLKHLAEPMHELRDLARAGKVEIEVEKPAFFDRNWMPIDEGEHWLITKPDITVLGPVALTIDLKTGKKFGNEVKHYSQLELYSIARWRLSPSYEQYIGEDWYADAKDITQHVFTPAKLQMGLARLDKEVETMMNDKAHTPRPTKLNCSRCPFSPRGTGACPAGVT